jgi:hypothetical protein
MRVWLYFLFLFAIPLSLYAQGPVLEWEKTTHDFGNVTQGAKVEYTFKYTNRGDQPLFITNVEVGCGCTTPKGWGRDPVKPGQRGELLISFNTASKSGKQTKTIKVISNAVNPESAQLTLHANVLTHAPNQ